MDLKELNRAKMQASKFIDRLIAEYGQGGLLILPPESEELRDDFAEELIRFQEGERLA